MGPGSGRHTVSPPGHRVGRLSTHCRYWRVGRYSGRCWWKPSFGCCSVPNEVVSKLRLKGEVCSVRNLRGAVSTRHTSDNPQRLAFIDPRKEELKTVQRPLLSWLMGQEAEDHHN